MQDDEQQQNGEQQPEEALAEDAAAEDDSQAEEIAAPAEEAPAETAEETPAETDDQTSAEDVGAQDDSAAEAPKEIEPPADAAQSGSGDARGAGEDGSSKKSEDVVPGAELDPIAIEPERELDAEERARREAEEEERQRRERELIGDADEEAAPLAAKPARLSGDASYAATGKRKSSVARVILRPGSGSIEVNKRQLEEYFPRSYLQTVAKQPLTQTGYEGSVDVRIRVHGGGISGQAAAVRHGIARALTEVDPALRSELKRRGMLTRDARVKERRKAGLKKARKKPQFSKR
jgi:small subunit ribosomal protein S9